MRLRGLLSAPSAWAGLPTCTSPPGRPPPCSLPLARECWGRWRGCAPLRRAGGGVAGLASWTGSGGSGRRNGKAAAAALAASITGVAWLTYEDRRGGLIGGPFEPLTLHVAAVRMMNLLSIFRLSLSGLVRADLPIVVLQFVRGSRAALALVMVAADYKLSLRGLEKGSEQYKETLEDCHTRAADKVLKLCRTQAGVYIKAGQLLASLRPVVPRQFTDALAQLCDDAPQSPIRDVRRVFREELGADMEQIFHHVDPEPLGCASLAQVHKAWLKEEDGSEGEVVALKVQHAWMSKHTQSDTLVMETAAQILEFLFPDVEMKWLIPVFRRNLSSELNFMCEAGNMQRCAHNFDGVPGVRVPELMEKFTSKRVLTMEFIDGVKVNDVDGLRAQGFDPARVGREVTRIFGEMVFCHGFVHCDPHPGNLLVTRPQRAAMDGNAVRAGRGAFEVVVLDHGLYREISDQMRRGYCEMWEAMILQDAAALQKVADAMGVGEYARLFPLIFTMRAIDSKVKLGDRMSKDERARVRDTLGVTGFSRDNFKLAEVLHFTERIPRDLLFIIRTQNLVRSLCADLGFAPRQRFRLYASLAARGKALHNPLIGTHAQGMPGQDCDTPTGRDMAKGPGPEAAGQPRAQDKGWRSLATHRPSPALRAWQLLRSLNLEIRMLLIEMGLWLSSIFSRAGPSAAASASGLQGTAAPPTDEQLREKTLLTGV